MEGIKSHTHEDRTKILKKLVPPIKRKFGNNFVALAADGSYARNEDTDYSDLELIVFLKKIPKNANWGVRKIMGGLLVEIIPDTKILFIEKYLEISDTWYASGAGQLLPIVNKQFIEKINSFKPDNLEKKCWDQAVKRWNLYQEITSKVLNNIKQKNRGSIPLILSQMIKEILIILSFINTTPYKTLGTYIAQAKQFSIQPKEFNKLIDIFVNGKYQDLLLLAKVTEDTFSGLEKIFQRKGIKLYFDAIL